MRPISTLILLGALFASTTYAADIEYVRAGQNLSDMTVVDTRPQPSCMHRSVAGAHCLAAQDLIGPRGELPNFRDLLWAFGTAGLSGHETVLVVGDRPLERDFVAGLLYLAGQAKVRILDQNISDLLRGGVVAAGSGRGRASLRDPIYVAQMRDDDLVLPGELRLALKSNAAPVPVDGRASDSADTQQEWGTPGRIPNSASQPLDAWYRHLDFVPLRFVAGPSAPSYVAYGYGSVDSIALFTRLRGLTHANVRVLLGGWRAWAASASAPIPHSETRNWRSLSAWLLIAAGTALIGFTGFSIARGKRWI